MKNLFKRSKSISKSKTKKSKAKIAYLVLVGALFLTTLGHVGATKFSEYQVRNAKAGGFAFLYGNSSGYKVEACKIWTIYGHFVRVRASKPALHSGVYLHVNTYRGPYEQNFLTSNSSGSWWGNVVTVVDTYAGNGNFKAYVKPNGGSTYFTTGLWNVMYMPSC